MGETDGEKIYNAFDGLIDEAEKLGFYTVANRLRKMRDRLPDKPTAVDRRIQAAWVTTAEWTHDRTTVQLEEIARSLHGCNDNKDVTDLGSVEAELEKRKAREYLQAHGITWGL
jgi:hypothetical protein